ncbi:MAG: ORF6N domain-containing protein [Mangrovibacterium sp.]|nr:ORF6N domain-containing protein [Mangrovibacterium sp.]
MELQVIQSKIYEIRGTRVMLDFDLAEMYEVETRVLNQAVKRNINRFPPDFMFQLTKGEWEMMSSQIVMTYPVKRPKTALPAAFTEQGLAMLSGILNSEKAVNVNINIMRAFVAIRKYMINASPSSLSRELEEIKERIKALEGISEENEEKFDDIYMALTELAMKQKLSAKPHNPIGFIKPKEE